MHVYCFVFTFITFRLFFRIFYYRSAFRASVSGQYYCPLLFVFLRLMPPPVFVSAMHGGSGGGISFSFLCQLRAASIHHSSSSIHQSIIHHSIIQLAQRAAQSIIHHSLIAIVLLLAFYWVIIGLLLGDYWVVIGLLYRYSANQRITSV